MAAWHEEPIGKEHHRDAFDCGEEALTDFLRRYARKSHDLGGAKTFLAIDDGDNKTLLGFYSLSPASVEYARTPDTVNRGLARHDVPASAWLGWPWIESCRGKELAGNYCLRLAAAA